MVQARAWTCVQHFVIFRYVCTVSVWLVWSWLGLGLVLVGVLELRLGCTMPSALLPPKSMGNALANQRRQGCFHGKPVRNRRENGYGHPYPKHSRRNNAPSLNSIRLWLGYTVPRHATVEL